VIWTSLLSKRPVRRLVSLTDCTGKETAAPNTVCNLFTRPPDFPGALGILSLVVPFHVVIWNGDWRSRVYPLHQRHRHAAKLMVVDMTVHESDRGARDLIPNDHPGWSENSWRSQEAITICTKNEPRVRTRAQIPQPTTTIPGNNVHGGLTRLKLPG